MMKFTQFLQQNIVLMDGGTGTVLQAKGLSAGQAPETWNLTHADEIVALHKAYFDAGSNVVCANTFGANLLKYDKVQLDNIVCAALDNAKKAKAESAGKQEKYVALDVGPLGKLLRPYGDLDFEDAVSIFAETVRLGEKYGADFIFIETMNDAYETKAAVLAAKENSALPIVVSNAYGEDGKLMTGANPDAMAATLEGLGVAALGANCSLGPKQLSPVIERLLRVSSTPVLCKANAGLPKVVDGETVYDISAEEFAKETVKFVEKGVRIVGGCCGTTPEHMQALAKRLQGKKPKEIIDKNRTVVSSYTHAVEFGKKPILIGERINPTGKKRLKQALKEYDIAYILAEGVTQQEKGAHVLDVNVGTPEIDETVLLPNVVCELQAVVDLPLQIDTANVAAMENALRRYNGKPLINSVNGKKESMETVFPLVKKYGGVVVALTLDEGGIPQNAGGRYEIARKILKTAAEYGIDKKDIIFDTLAMAISTDANAAETTLTALKRIKTELKCHTSLGVSNVSFGLPNRDEVNAAFFALALQNGLSAAIMNPNSTSMLQTYYAYNAGQGADENGAEYVRAMQAAVENATPTPTTNQKDLRYAVEKGFKEQAKTLTKEGLQTRQPMSIVNEEIIPALNAVGEGFENKTVYLPQLLMSAEAAQAAFEVIKTALLSSGETNEKQAAFVIATVQGDIHDIGKNIVKLLLENYGFDVIDLGKDVPPETIVAETVKRKARLVGLSALMTTTLPAMERTVQLLKAQAPWCKIVVGGAVLTKEYAEKIGADCYAKDAMETVRFAQKTTK